MAEAKVQLLKNQSSNKSDTSVDLRAPKWTSSASSQKSTSNGSSAEKGSTLECCLVYSDDRLAGIQHKRHLWLRGSKDRGWVHMFFSSAWLVS